MSMLARATARAGRMKFAIGTSVAGGALGLAESDSNPFTSGESRRIWRNNFAACEMPGMNIGGVDFSKYLPGSASDVKKPDWVTVETMQPLAGGLTFGGASGIAAGIACKKIGKAVAVGVGGVYCLFQVAASYGYITVNWKKVERDVMSALDTNGDGKIDEKDAGAWLGKALQVLSNDEAEGTASRNAAAGGFITGFLYGLRF